MSTHSITTGFQKTSDGIPTQAQLDDDLRLKVTGTLAVDDGTGNTVQVGLPNQPIFTASIGTFSCLFDYNGGSDLVYLGLAYPGTLTSDPFSWQIRKFTYDGSGNLTSMLYAGGNYAFTWRWDDRASYTYV